MNHPKVPLQLLENTLQFGIRHILHRLATIRRHQRQFIRISV